MRQYHKILKAIDIYSYRRFLEQMFIMLGLLLFSLVSGSALANPFATPDNFDAASCPIGHKKYTIANTASTAPSLSSWVNGERSRTFTFNESSGNKTFTINFPLLIDANNSYGTVPFYGSNSGFSSNAINLVHNSTRVQKDHTLDVSINRPVSKIGYKIQDLDSTTVQVNVGPWWFPIYEDRAPYIEQVDVSKNNGRLTFNSVFHDINPEQDIVTAKEGRNCSTGQCTIDATWGYKPAGSTVNLNHNNTKREANGSHAVGYSDFYFCLAPPKIIVNKLLNGSRVDSDDQFRIELRQTSDDAFVEAFTTTGSGSVVTDNTTTVKTLSEGFSYTVSEQTINGNLLDYQTSYTCSNAATDTDIILSSGTMPVNAAGTRRTFAINNVDYGDEITCNITNTPVNNYTFTGFVFNDNGGIAEDNSTNLDTNTKYDISSTFTGNNNYFNGKFEREIEQGIYASGLQVRLTDCGDDDGGTNIAGTTAKNVSDAPATLGQFKFTVPASALANLTTKEVCLVQVEPDPWTFSVDTTPNLRKISLVAGKFDYKTDGSRNLDFGEVKANYASLVLIKSQHVNDCDINANYDGISFSTAEIDGIEPGRCIAYKIDAYNRGHVDIRDVEITDKLRQTPVKSVFHLPYPKGSSSAIYDNTGLLPIGTTIVSKIFNLDKPTGTSATKATLYFNTKYGTSNSNTPQSKSYHLSIIYTQVTAIVA